MEAQTVRIQRFRSIEDVALESIGRFNVFIGKNNAGKSTILGAISAFFDCLRPGQVVHLEPPIGIQLDFFDSDASSPIRISVTFKMSQDELVELQDEVASGAPQLEEVARAFTIDHRLRVTLCVTPPPETYAYVEYLELEPSAADPRSLLEVSPGSAKELRAVASWQQRSIQDQRFLLDLHSNLGEGEWKSYRNIAGSQPLQYWRRGSRGSASSEAQDKTNALWSGLETFEAFRSEVSALAASLQDEVNKANATQLKEPVKTFGGEQTQVPDYLLNLLQRVGAIKVHYLRERREPIGREEARQLLDLKVKRGGLERLQEIQTTVAGLLGVKLDAFGSTGTMSTPSRSPEMDVDDFVVQVNGAGIREALRIVLDVEFGEPDLLLVEEPEIHLHPAMETSLMQYLKRIGNRTQVLLSTHSTNFLDIAEMRNVYLVSKPPHGATGVQLLDTVHAEEAIPRELGIRLSSLFMFDRLAFVEGPTDESVLREWATTLGINLSQANVGFIPMGGARNFAYFAAERTLAFLSNRRVEMWFILDRDERDDEDVARLVELAGEHPHVVVLKRRELENYLIKPRPLAEFVALKRELGGLPLEEITDEETTAVLEECADDLKDLTLQKQAERRLGRPLYRSAAKPYGDSKEIISGLTQDLEAMQKRIGDRLGMAEETITSIADDLEKQWAAKKLSLVPGDELLDHVCKRWGVRYRKERGDGSRIASLMEATEISDEMKELLKSLAD
jgi:putative ATP-dependent endonuclease of OLD family